METYIQSIKFYYRKTNIYSGKMDDCVDSLEEHDHRIENLYYEKGMLIFVEQENQIYKIYSKVILTLKDSNNG